MAYAVTVTFEIAPGQMDAFMPLMRGNAAASVRDEPGCLQFDICSGGSNTVFLYEIYTDRGAFDAHMQTQHFKTFDAAVADMVIGKTVATFDHVTRNPA